MHFVIISDQHSNVTTMFNNDKTYGGKCLLNWKRICAPISVGGLGMKELAAYSRALRLHWPCYEWGNIDRPFKGTATPCDDPDHQSFAACSSIQLGKWKKSTVLN